MRPWIRALRTAFRLILDVTVTSLIGMLMGACTDRMFDVTDVPSETLRQATGLLLGQALVNGVVLFAFVKAYERVAVDVDAYLGYSTFITLLYCCQPVFTTRAILWRDELFPS